LKHPIEDEDYEEQKNRLADYYHVVVSGMWWLNHDFHTVAQIKDREDVFLLDVREQWEYDEGHIPGITLLPMGEVSARLDEIPTDKEVIVTCRSGNRSGQITDYLRQNGFDNVHNMEGGILAWEKAGYEVAR
jgi:rhodanese-related sulfurtransferase